MYQISATKHSFRYSSSQGFQNNEDGSRNSTDMMVKQWEGRPLETFEEPTQDMRRLIKQDTFAHFYPSDARCG